MNENRMIMIMFFIIDSVEFESGMCVIYRNIQWILLAWHAFFILSSTCKHDKTLCVAPTSAVRVGICFFGPFFLQLSFFVLNSCPKLCTYLFWFWKRNCQVHQQRTFEHQQGNVLKVVRDVITPPTPPTHRFTWASILQRTCEHLTGLPLGRDPINKPQQSFSLCERKALHCELLYTAVRFTIPNGSLSRVTRSPWKFSQSLLLNLWQLHH